MLLHLCICSTIPPYIAPDSLARHPSTRHWPRSSDADPASQLLAAVCPLSPRAESRCFCPCARHGSSSPPPRNLQTPLLYTPTTSPVTSISAFRHIGFKHSCLGLGSRSRAAILAAAPPPHQPAWHPCSSPVDPTNPLPGACRHSPMADPPPTRAQRQVVGRAYQHVASPRTARLASPRCTLLAQLVTGKKVLHTRSFGTARLVDII